MEDGWRLGPGLQHYDVATSLLLIKLADLVIEKFLGH